jgi:hypothetical protein
VVVLVAADRADEVALLAVLRLAAQQQQTEPSSSEDLAATAQQRIGWRAMASVFTRRGDPVPDSLAELLKGDTEQRAAADQVSYIAAWDALGKSGAYQLVELERVANEWVPVSEALEQILESMPDWARDLVVDEIRQMQDGRRVELFCWGKSPSETFPSGPTRRALGMAKRAVGADSYPPGDYDGPLVMPEQICRALLENPRDSESRSGYDCGSCGYELPQSWAQRDAHGNFTGYLACPACGGAVGYGAWYETKRVRHESGAR